MGQQQARANAIPSNEELSGRYSGGEIEIQNQVEDYLFRGQVKTCSIQDGTLHAEITRMAQLGPDGRWHEVEPRPYEAALEIYAAQDIGGDRFLLRGWITHETTTLFPKDGSRLDWSKIVKD